jgi:hypothetical protein
MTDQSTTTQDAPNTEGEQSQETAPTQVVEAPKKSKAERIHDYVTVNRIISQGKGDTVRTKQAEKYLEMFGDQDPLEHPVLAGLDADKLLAICQNGATVLPIEERKARAEHYQDLPPSHQWLKGIAATAIAMRALDELDAGEEQPTGAAENIELVTGEQPDEERVEEITAEADANAEGAGEADQAEAEGQQDEQQGESDES